MKPQPFQLARIQVSTDTVTALEALLKQAKSSQIIGFSYIAMYKRREFTVNATGEARRSPTFARGAAAALDDYLEKLVHKE